MRWRHISRRFVWSSLSNTGIMQNTSAHQCEKLVTAFELCASIGHAQYSIEMFSCACLLVQRHELLLTPMGFVSSGTLAFTCLVKSEMIKNWLILATPCLLSSAIVKSSTIASNVLRKTSNVSMGQSLFRCGMSITRSGSSDFTASWTRSSISWYNNS